jgi:hypothetical protein
MTLFFILLFGIETSQCHVGVSSTTLAGLVLFPRFYRILDWGRLLLRLPAVCARNISDQVVFRAALNGGDAWSVLMSASSIMRAESSLLTTKKILAERIEPFQLLQAKSVITHLRIRQDLGGSGLTQPTESALLAIEKILAKADHLSQLLELKKVFLQGVFFGQALLGPAGAGCIGLGVTRLDRTDLLRAKKAANASQLLQRLQATDPQLPAQLDEPLEQMVATLGFEKLALELGKLLVDFVVEPPGLIQLAQKGSGIEVIAVIAVIARDRRHRGEIG